MYTLVDGVEFYDKDEVDDIVRAITGGSLPNEDGIRNELTTKIDAETAEREQADIALRAELGARIDEETVAREAATAANKSLIDLETQSRVVVDALLSNQLAAIEQLHTTLIGPNGFVDSDGDTVKANDSGKSIRQIAHEEFYRQLITDADDVKTQLDTLKELADYLQRNPSVLTDMYSKLGITWSVDNPTDFGTFDFSTVLTATNVDDAVLELYNTFTDKIGDLAQLTTTFKDSVVGAINELDSTIKSKVYTDVKTVAFTPTSPDVPPTALNNTTKHFAASTTATFADVYAKLSDDMQSFIAILDIDKRNRIYASVVQITDTSITFCSTRCITKVTDSATVNTYQDTTINWFNDGSADVIITDDYTATRIDEEVTARTDADTALGTRIDEEVGDIDSLKTTAKSSTVAAINELYDTVQQGGGDDSTVPAPSADTPYIIEITTDTLDPPATVLGGLSPDVVAGIQAAVAANRPLAIKLMRTDDPTVYVFIPEYGYTDNMYTFINSTTTWHSQDITISNYIMQVDIDKANYTGQIINKEVAIPEGGSEPLYVTARGAGAGTGTGQLTDFSATYDEIVAEVSKNRLVILKIVDRSANSYLPLVSYNPNDKLAFDPAPLVFGYCIGSPSTDDHLHYANVYVSKDSDGNTTGAVLSGEVGGEVGGGGGGGGSGGTSNTATNCEQFTFVVDSNEKLAEWANNDTSKGQDYTSVLIRKGEWTSTVGVNLTTTGTKVVVGEAGSKLVFNAVEKGLYYDTAPTQPDYYMHGVTVEVTGESGTGESDTGSGNGYGFHSCSNLSNCTGTGTGTGTGRGYGFHSCSKLSNCTGTGTGRGYGYGFHSCSNLSNCTGTGTVEVTGSGNGTGSGYGFHSCSNLSNCTGTGTGESGTGTGTGSGFYDCSNLSNCTGTGTGTGTSDSGTGSGYGFYDCSKLSNCTGTGTGAGESGIGTGRGFHNCAAVIGCKAGANCTTTVFNNCYASNAKTSNYACADTANGGFNDTTNPSA